MKAIIASVLSAIIAVMGLAAPAGATNTFGAYGAGNGGMSNSNYLHVGLKDGKLVLEADIVGCMKSNIVWGVNGSVGSAQPAQQEEQAVLPSANTSSCNATEVVNNPPAGTTVTINGVCGTPEEIAKIKATNANLVINSVGLCPTDGSKPATPPTVIVTQKETVVKTVSADTTPSTPVTLPQTGIDGTLPLVAGGLAVLAYGATMAVRAFRG